MTGAGPGRGGVPGAPVTVPHRADATVVADAADPYVTSTDVLLVVEVSLSTMVRDHGAMAEAYADGKIPW